MEGRDLASEKLRKFPLTTAGVLMLISLMNYRYYVSAAKAAKR